MISDCPRQLACDHSDRTGSISDCGLESSSAKPATVRARQSSRGRTVNLERDRSVEAKVIAQRLLELGDSFGDVERCPGLREVRLKFRQRRDAPAPAAACPRSELGSAWLVRCARTRAPDEQQHVMI